MSAAGRVAGALEGILASPGGIRTPDGGGPWTVAGEAPGAVAFPETVEELAALLSRASAEGLSVLPAGAGSWLGGGGLARSVDLVVSTRRMDRIEEYVPGNLTLTAGAGLPVERLDREARENGQWFPQDPPGWPDATLGAVVAAGLPGPLVASYGRPRDQILGLTLVTGDGRVIRPGGRVVKNVAGYDLVRPVAGSWGALGVVAGITVRLFPVPETDRTLLWEAGTAAGLVEVARGAATAPVVPGALELLDPAPESAGTDGAVLAARLLGSEEAVAEQESLMRDAAGRPPDRRVEGRASMAWHRRRAAEERTDGAGGPPAALELRAALLPSDLSGLLGVTDRLLEAGGGERGCLRRVHVTTGTARLRLTGVDGDRAGAAAPPELLREVRAELEREGGSLALVRGPAPLLEAVGARGAPGGVARLMEGLRRAFDPTDTLASVFADGMGG